MPACGEHATMSSKEFWLHIDDLINDMVTAATSALESDLQADARSIQKTIREYGHEGLHEDQLAKIAMWQDTFGINPAYVDNFSRGYPPIRVAVNSYIEESLLGSGGDVGFGRVKQLPDPAASVAVIDELMKLCGTGTIRKVSDPDGGEMTIPGEGILGDVSIATLNGIETSTLKDWQSETGSSFKVDFLGRAGEAIKGQREVAATMSNCMDLHLGMLQTARGDFDGLAHDAVTALQSVDQCEWFRDDDFGAVLGMAAGLLAITAAVASTNIAVAAGVASGTATFFQSHYQKGDEVPALLAADTIDGVVNNIVGALNKITTNLDDSYTTLANNGLRPVLLRMVDKDQRDSYVAPLPNDAVSVLENDPEEILLLKGCTICRQDPTVLSRCGIEARSVDLRLRRGFVSAVVAVMAMTALAGCSSSGKDLVAPSPDSTSPGATCFERVDDAGDLEVTDSGFTVLNPDDPEGSYRVSVAVEVTNTSATETMVVAEVAVRLLDAEGVKLRGEPTEATASVAGWLKFIEPGGSAYFGDVIKTWKSKPLDSLLVELGPSHWRAESEVTYPEQLVVSDVTVTDEDTSQPLLQFTVASDDEYVVERGQVIFRDNQGDLIGGGRARSTSRYVYIRPGSHEYYYKELLRYVMPPSTDQTSIEVYLDNVPPWEEVEPACAGVFELRTAE